MICFTVILETEQNRNVIYLDLYIIYIV